MHIFHKSLFKFVLVLIAFSSNFAWCETKDQNELSQKGLLAGSAHGGYGGTQIGGWGAGATGGMAAPLGGSVVKIGSTWKLKIVNNSEDSYHASFEAVQLDGHNKRLKGTPFSARIKGSGSFDRSIKAHPSAAHCNLRITRWKKVN